MYSNESKIAPQSSFVPRFLTSAPLMFQFSSPNTSVSTMDGACRAPGKSYSNLIPDQTLVNSSTFNPFGEVIRPSSFRVPPSQFIDWSRGGVYSPYPSSSVLGAPISNFTSPGSTIVNLPPVMQLPSTGALESRTPFGQVNENVLNARDQALTSAQWKLSKPVSQSSFEGVAFDKPNVTLSSPIECGRSVDSDTRRSVSKPRGELVGLRVNEIEDQLRRQSMSHQSVSHRLRPAISN